MSVHSIPQALRGQVIESFDNEEQPAYGQAATLDDHGRLQVRTVHFRFIPELEAIGFSTHSRSPKWRQLEANSVLGCCYFDMYRQIQYRWEGTADLLRVDAASGSELDLLTKMWRLIRPELRTLYCLDAHGLSPGMELPAEIDLGRPVPSMGTVVCRPRSWDVLVIVAEDYRKDRRTGYWLEDGAWREAEISPLHAAPIGEDE